MQRTIPLHALPEVHKAVAKLNRRAAKLGLEPVRLIEGERRVKIAINVNGAKVRYETIALELQSPPIKLSGWTLLAKLEHLEGGVIVKALPGARMGEEWWQPRHVCTHCNTRRVRKAYYVLQGDDGSFQHVGSSCLKDFIGRNATQALFAGDLSDRIGEIMDEADRSPRKRLVFGAMAVLMMTAAVIRECGWVSRKQARENAESGRGSYLSTSDVVLDQMTLLPQERAKKGIKITERDRRVAQATVAWLKALDNPSSDYEHNLWVLTKAFFQTEGYRGIDIGHLGIFCSAVPTANRGLGKQVAAEQVNAHVGKVGERREFRGTVVNWNSYEGQFGPTHYTRVETQEGLVVVKSSTTWWDEEKLTQGSEISFKATVKRHGERGDRMVTQVNRAVQL